MPDGYLPPNMSYVYRGLQFWALPGHDPVWLESEEAEDSFARTIDRYVDDGIPMKLVGLRVVDIRSNQEVIDA